MTASPSISGSKSEAQELEQDEPLYLVGVVEPSNVQFGAQGGAALLIILTFIGAVVAACVLLGLIRAFALLSALGFGTFALLMATRNPRGILVDATGQLAGLVPIHLPLSQHLVRKTWGLALVAAASVVAVDVFRGFEYDSVMQAAFAAQVPIACVMVTLLLLYAKQTTAAYREWRKTAQAPPKDPPPVSMDEHGTVAFRFGTGLPFPGLGTSPRLVRLLFSLLRSVPPSVATALQVLAWVSFGCFFAAAAASEPFGQAVLDITGIPLRIVAAIGIPAFAAWALYRVLFGHR
jgi:hypothetical protein